MREVLRCPSCFSPKTARTSTCENCDHAAIATFNNEDLPIGTPLADGQFVLGRVVGHGSLTTSYVALDPVLDRRVTIKEFLPSSVAGRDRDGRRVKAFSAEHAAIFEYARERFRLEARTVCQFQHANIAQVLGYVQDNGTDYLVTEHFAGETLASYVDRHGPVPHDPALDMIRIAWRGLAEVHRDRGGVRYVHRNIKPSNVFLAEIGHTVVPKLLDFGAARLAVGERSHNLAQVLAPGYAAPEQYRSSGAQGPWTDVYSAAAILFFVLTGTRPPSAIDRVDADDVDERLSAVPEVTQDTIDAVLRGLALRAPDRPKDADALLAMLDECI
jgi:serine/threonine protein kinase